MFSINEINNLKEENKELKNKLKRLQRQYKNVLELAKKNADANEYCLKNLEESYAEMKRSFESAAEKNTKLESNIIEIQKDYNTLYINAEQVAKQRDKYKSALDQIQEVAKNNIKIGCAISGGYIEQLIDEVLNDRRKNYRN